MRLLLMDIQGEELHDLAARNGSILSSGSALKGFAKETAYTLAGIDADFASGVRLTHISCPR
jgi:hypothetical protein